MPHLSKPLICARICGHMARTGHSQGECVMVYFVLLCTLICTCGIPEPLLRNHAGTGVLIDVYKGPHSCRHCSHAYRTHCSHAYRTHCSHAYRTHCSHAYRTWGVGGPVWQQGYWRDGAGPRGLETEWPVGKPRDLGASQRQEPPVGILTPVLC
jgi:hypothetical protein